MDFRNCTLGIELGSTRIKAVIVNENNDPAASGAYEWENVLSDGIWTYPMEKITEGVQKCYSELKKNVRENYGETLNTVGAIGISGMMHGFFAFDRNWKLLTPFRTWRNTMTKESAERLTELFSFNIPQRWSIAHLYQAMLNKEEYLNDLSHLTTLSGYIHHLLTGENVLGIGEASGMFPICSSKQNYDGFMEDSFEELRKTMGYNWSLHEILPSVLKAGEQAGVLSEDGARFLDPDGDLRAGIPLCPPEGDAGTGMVATNSVRVRTGNVSAGTSDFAMVVVEKNPGVHREIDMVTTPSGLPVAMVHCNNCTSDINAWVNLLCEFGSLMGTEIDKNQAFSKLFSLALTGLKDGGGLMSVNYLSGEGITDFDEGRPLFFRTPDAEFTLANFMRTHLMSALAALKIGLDILTVEEKVKIDTLYGHGGFFKTPEVGQTLLSAAIGTPVSVMKTAGEGGPYGMALLAAYMLNKNENESLEDYLDRKVFNEAESVTLMADEEETDGFRSFIKKYIAALPVEKAAILADRGENGLCWKN